MDSQGMCKLVEDIRSGSAVAKEQLIDLLTCILMPIAVRMCNGNAQDAEDAVQNCLIRLLSHLPPPDVNSVQAYAIRILINIIFTEHRKRKRRPTEQFNDETTLIDGSEDQPLDNMLGYESVQTIRAAIQRLPVDQSQAISLHIEGLSYVEIGEEMERSVRSVQGLLQRARKNLREDLTTYFTEDGRPRRSASG